MDQLSLLQQPTPKFSLSTYPAIAFSGCRKVVPEKQLAQALTKT